MDIKYIVKMTGNQANQCEKCFSFFVVVDNDDQIITSGLYDFSFDKPRNKKKKKYISFWVKFPYRKNRNRE
ncbi:hypothetical protein DERF_002970 [Dermatophagoides farinae]|uniref:Uncharacterized protein n=1 Tax=Dermatophagoides farinae TaxID=6954 RepID=A0A922LA44_DERFA|nr:hypothetical protein DERF_002970 [Dermatophagoides farinae]